MILGDKKVLAIIPARGGSKRLPRKNILPLGGKALISWTIEAAQASEYIDKVIVSTEDDEIIAVAEGYGNDIPLLRPKALATDNTTTIDVVLHVINELEIKGSNYDYVVLLQPTSPYRTVQHINAAFEQLFDNKSNAVVSVCLSEHHPLWCNSLPEDNSMSSFLSSTVKNKRSQDLPDYYRLNGAIYICNIAQLKSERTFLPSYGCSAYIMTQEDSVDIDTKGDFDRAQLILDKNMAVKATLVEQLLEHYTQKGLGRFSREESDFLIFEVFVKQYCLLQDRSITTIDDINYFDVDEQGVDYLSTTLKISKEQVDRYFEILRSNMGTMFRKKSILYWIEKIKSQVDQQEKLSDGYLRWHGSSWLLSKFLESEARYVEVEVATVSIVNLLQVCESNLETLRLWASQQGLFFSEEQEEKLLESLTLKNVGNVIDVDRLSRILGKICVDHDALLSLLNTIAFQWNKRDA